MTLERIGVRLGRHTVTYGLASAVSVLVSIGTVAIFTRYLRPAEFGELVLFLLVATTLMIVYNLGSLQGSYMWVYGAAAEEGGDAGDAGADAAPAVDKRAAMGSGLVLTGLVATGGTLLVIPFAPEIADVLTGDVEDSTAVIVAAVTGALAAVWRFLSNIPRMERRPVAFAVLLNLRKVIALAVGFVLLADGHGALGALVGAAVGAGLSVAAGLIATRSSFRIALRASDIAVILRRGAVFVPVVAAIAVIQNGDVFLVSRFTSEADTGVYRVASGIGAVMSYGVSAFLMAWGPLERTPAFAVVNQGGGAGEIRAKVLTYFVVASVGAFLGFAVLADVIVRVAGDEFAAAAELIPMAGLSFLLSGAFVVVYRSVRFPQRMRAYMWLALLAAAVFLASAPILISELGSIGALVASSAGYGTAICGLLFLSQRGAMPIRMDWRRVALSLLVGAGCFAAGLAANASGLTALAALSVLAYPLLLVWTGVVERRHLRPVWNVVRLAFWPPNRAHMRQSIAALGPDDRALIALLARERWSAARVAARTGRAEPEISVELVRVVRDLGELHPAGPHDELVGAYLLSQESVADREQLARTLYERGIDPLDLDRVETTFAEVRRAGRRLTSLEPVPAGARTGEL